MGIKDRLLNAVVGVPGVLGAFTRFEWGSIPTRVRYGLWTRPHYAYGIYSAAEQASRLGLKRICAIELGVAGGNGLVAMEDIARRIAAHFGLEIEVYGFDAGSGMPAPIDYRDLPHVWEQGYYKMDEAALKARLSSAQLFIGNVRETVPRFNSQDHAPIGFVAFDLDYYSSTKDAFGLFEGGPQSRLPRVYCYMDDIIWPEYACQNDFVGELLAMKEFNERHEALKICRLHLLRHMRPKYFPWNDQIYVLHDFRHPLYTQNITHQGKSFREIPLR